MIRTYRSGNVIEKSKFWVPDRVKPRARKLARTKPRKQDANDRDMVKRIARILNCNFFYRLGDIFLTLTFDEKGMKLIGGDYARAEHEMTLFLRRAGYALKNHGRELRYFGIVSDLDENTGEYVRLHCHIVMSSADAALLRRLWPYGTADVRTIKAEDDHTGLAVYLAKQMRRRTENDKRYTVSRNLKKPEITETISYRKSPLRAPAGARITGSGEFDIERGTHYIRYVPRTGKTAKTKIGGHREGLGGEDGNAIAGGKEAQGIGVELSRAAEADKADLAATI